MFVEPGASPRLLLGSMAAEGNSGLVVFDFAKRHRLSFALRGDDIMLLAEHFLREFTRRAGRRAMRFTAAARKRLESHTWPGNVRELRNLMERIAYLSSSDRVEAEDLAFILSPTSTSPRPHGPRKRSPGSPKARPAWPSGR